MDGDDARCDRGEGRHGRDRYLRPIGSNGSRVAQECIETKDGLTIWEDHFYEVIDPETGRVLPDGEKGELVFTSLTKEALPDHPLSHAISPGLPATARSMRRMEKITGRSDDDDHHPRRQRVSDPGRGLT